MTDTRTAEGRHPTYKSDKSGVTEGAQLLKLAVFARGLTHEQAGSLIGASRMQVAAWANAHCCPTRVQKMKLFREFNVPVEAWSKAVSL